MSNSIGGVMSARASYDDGNWCGTKPGPRPHFDLGAIFSRFEQVALNPQPLPPKAGGKFAMDEQCGTVPKKLHWPPPPPPPWADVAGPVSHVVLNALMGARGM